MIDQLHIANVLFLDIETASNFAHFDDLSEKMQELWAKKARQIYKKEDLAGDDLEASYSEKAAIYSEFGKIICISVGIVVQTSNGLSVRLKSFAHQNEATLLREFSDLVNKYYNDLNKHYFCGHNIKEFDIPYICRRLMLNKLPLPAPFELRGKKPWETKHLLDTMELWKFGDNKSFTSLDLLTTIFDIPSPKDDISGADVGRVFWEENDLARIATYCEKDVLAVIQLMLRYQRKDILTDEQIISVGT